jgi:DNA-directed RNA polymerase specialized sigma24 family protein
VVTMPRGGRRTVEVKEERDRRSLTARRSNDEFNNLLRRAKAGDEGAIRDFLAQFEQDVQTMVRSRLPRKLRTRFDSIDFVQSVWQSFLVDRGDDSREFDDVEHFRGYLYGMVRNKVSEQHRRLTRRRPRGLARGCLARPDAQPDDSGQRPDGPIDGRPQPPRCGSAHTAPTGLDVHGDCGSYGNS